MVVWLAANWGNIASVVGAILTVWYSHKAVGAARAAERAAQETERKLDSVDAYSELTRAGFLMAELLRRVDSSSWEIAAERANDIRLIFAAVGAGGASLSEGLRDALSQGAAQFRDLSNNLHGSSQRLKRSPSMVRIREVVSDQQEVVALAQVELRSKMGRKDG